MQIQIDTAKSRRERPMKGFWPFDIAATAQIITENEREKSEANINRFAI